MALVISLSIIGILLIIAEILLIPGFFITGLLGLASVTASCFFAFDRFGQTGGIITIAVNIIVTLAAILLSMRGKTWDKVALTAQIDSRTDSNPEDKGIVAGCGGVTVTRLNPMGKVLINDHIVEASAENGIIDENTPVEVISTESNRIYVKPK